MSTLQELAIARQALRAELDRIENDHPDGDRPADIEQRIADIGREGNRLAAQERLQLARNAIAREAPGTPLDAPETRATVRVGGRDVALPAGFDGRVLETQTGQRVPVLEARHRLTDFATLEDRAPISFGGFLRALHGGARDDTERRAMGEATIGAGGAMVPTPLSLQVIDLLRAQAVAFQAGVGVVPMDSATLKFARQIADPVGGWRAEAAAITEGTPAFDQATLTARSWALLVKVSRELLEDATNLDAVLQNSFAKAAALALDQAVLFGSGAANQPLGIANTVGIGAISLGVNGAQLTGWAPVLDGIEALELANSPLVTAAIMSPRTARAINGFIDLQGNPLRPPARVAGIPLLSSTSASITEVQGTANTASSILLGDFTSVYCGMRTALQVSILHERYADTGQVAFVLWLRADVLVTHPAALVRIAGIIP